MNLRCLAAILAVFGSTVASITVAAPAEPTTATCRARSDARAPAVIELYTSEGCSSCPPADRWASGLKGRRDVLVLGFHVNYWDKLGWPDRFADRAYTERQRAFQRATGAAYVYTPQVILNGRDWRGWSNAGIEALAPSGISVTLGREGANVIATVAAAPDARSPSTAGSQLAGYAQLAGYWAVLEDGHRSRVKSGENAGETLLHDHVVTRYQALDPWRAAQAQRFAFELAPTGAQAVAGAGAVSRRIAFVVTDAQGAKPLQALVLDC